MNRLLLDTANIDEIKELVRSRAIAGVTTNPSLMAKESKGKYWDKALEIAHAIELNANEVKHLSVEAISTVPDEIYSQTILAQKMFRREKFTKIHLFFKVPVTLSNLNVITMLASDLDPVNVNATACMTATQAKLAADAGARIVSFFFNRIKDGGGNPVEVLREFGWMRVGCQNTKVICGSIRKIEDVSDSWKNGADFVTASTEVVAKLTEHEQTTKAIDKFQKDIESWLS